jgi:hypothetical protein
MPHTLITHQTVKLSRGKHDSPREGACVMELASMLAGARFTDRPASVSPAIAGFLRPYNDYLSDELRQDLYGIAAQVVGSCRTPEVEQRRVERVVEWGIAMRRARPWRLWALLAPRPRPRRRSGHVHPDDAGVYAVRGLGMRRRLVHPLALELVEELLDYGRAERAAGRGFAQLGIRWHPEADVTLLTEELD